MDTGIIILSRFSSNRLPGKALMKIGDKPILQYVIDRIAERYDKSQIVIATSSDSSDDCMEEFASRHSINVFRGALDNVAERFLHTAQYYRMKYATRITGDSIFIDPRIIEEAVKINSSGEFDMVSNRKYGAFPEGQTVEVVDVRKYRKYYQHFFKPEHFEHVTPYYYECEKDKNINIWHMEGNGRYARDINLSINTIEDFQKAKSFVSANGIIKALSMPYTEITKYYEKYFSGEIRTASHC